jgi:hypothetical protein
MVLNVPEFLARTLNQQVGPEHFADQRRLSFGPHAE